MAITYTLSECGRPTDLGQDGALLCRLILDGSSTTVAITVPVETGMKTIKGIVGSGSVAANGIGSGVAGTTGFTLTTAAGTSGHAVDLLILGSGS